MKSGVHAAMQQSASSPFLPLPQHAESDAVGSLLPFAAGASPTEVCSGSGHSAGGEIEHLFGNAVVRSDPSKDLHMSNQKAATATYTGTK